MSTDEKILLGTAPVVVANRYKDLAAQRDITIELAYNASTCKTGCSHTMEVWANKQDLEAVMALMATEAQRNFSGLEFDPEVVGQVFDPEKEEAQCPACGTVFATSASECPDCGLGFAVPE